MHAYTRSPDTAPPSLSPPLPPPSPILPPSHEQNAQSRTRNVKLSAAAPLGGLIGERLVPNAEVDVGWMPTGGEGCVGGGVDAAGEEGRGGGGGGEGIVAGEEEEEVPLPASVSPQPPEQPAY